jgi:hypothetical protein
METIKNQNRASLNAANQCIKPKATIKDKFYERAEQLTDGILTTTKHRYINEFEVVIQGEAPF